MHHAAQLAASGDLGPVWLRADEQTDGKGRMARPWASPPSGNLYATLLTPVSEPPADIALRSFVAALAVSDAALALGVHEITLKWPNDVLLDGQKLAGILLESGSVGALRWLAIGCGVNLAAAPEGTRWPAISIAEHLGAPPMPDAAMNALRDAWDVREATFCASGFAPIREAWLERAAFLGEQIEARLPQRTLVGVFEGIDHHGCLLLRTESGTQRITAGDVHLPGMMDQREAE